MDFHRNVYYSYRGPLPTDADRDVQLENNLTKALVNTLDLGGEVVWRPFLAEFGLSSLPEAAFLLQRSDLPSVPAANRRHRVLLGISKHTSDWSPSPGCAASYESLPDAWMYGNGFAVLVESKVTGDFSPQQMQGHLARLRCSGHSEPKIALRTWGQLHEFFRRLLPDLKDASSRLLVEQFVQFLEFTGMSGFTGFLREHFDYFLLHDDEDARRWVLEQFHDLATRLSKILHKLDRFYESHDVGTLKRSDSYCWVAFGPADLKYRQVTHQTISFAADGLRVFVNAELKPATDRVKAVVAQPATPFRAALQDLHAFKPFSLELDERVPRQASLHDYIPKLRLHSSAVDDLKTRDVAWYAFSQMVQQLPLFELRIERLIAPPLLLELTTGNQADAIDFVAEILERNHAVVQLLNSGTRTKQSLTTGCMRGGGSVLE